MNPRMAGVKATTGWMAGAMLVCAMAGCASLSELPQESQSATWLPDLLTGASEVPASPPAFLVKGSLVARAAALAAEHRPQAASAPPATDDQMRFSGIRLVSQSQAAAAAPAADPPAEPPGTEELAPVPYDVEEFIDPFAQAEEESIEVYDPWQRFNQAMFTFNRKFDEFVLHPVAKVYDKVVPDPLEIGISNAINNVRVVPRTFNNLFQGKVKGAAIEVGRLLINSTLGIGGFYDFAGKVLHLKETPNEDFGQTLGVYNVKPGPYLVLPFLGSFTVRDGVGFVTDTLLDPFNWLVLPYARITGSGQLVTNTTTASLANTGVRAEQILNERAINVDKTFAGFEKETVDLYAAVRSAYVERRAKMIRE